MLINTILLSGAGNTFHLVGDDLSFLSKIQKKELTKEICSKDVADGLIFIKKDLNEATYQWDFYNNDGSDAEMCGNATRCVGYYIKNELKDPAIEWTLQTVAGNILIRPLAHDQYEITMTPLVLLKSPHGFYCNTGVPHLVIEIEKFEEYRTLKEQARHLRYNLEFLPAGTNVTYVKTNANLKKIKAVTYERGVEDFTEACGTGAVAAAFYNLVLHAISESSVEMPGGSLIVKLTNIEKPLMAGPAKQIGKFNYEFKI